jgi:hypothetical protein
MKRKLLAGLRRIAPAIARLRDEATDALVAHLRRASRHLAELRTIPNAPASRAVAGLISACFLETEPSRVSPQRREQIAALGQFDVIEPEPRLQCAKLVYEIHQY